jgi:hypothetical protein
MRSTTVACTHSLIDGFSAEKNFLISHKVQQVVVHRFAPLSHMWERVLLNFVANEEKFYLGSILLTPSSRPFLDAANCGFQV